MRLVSASWLNIHPAPVARWIRGSAQAGVGSVPQDYLASGAARLTLERTSEDQ
jgi:hypothetical protein